MLKETPLIISAAIGMQLEELFPMVRSLQDAKCRAEVVFLRHPNDAALPKEWNQPGLEFSSYSDFRMKLQEWLSRLRIPGFFGKAYGLLLSRLGKIGQVLAPTILHPGISRKFYAYDLLRKAANSRKVALIDSRDVIIQNDPFERFDGSCLIVAEEETTILENGSTNAWIRQLGRALPINMASILPKKVICAGVTLGTADCMRTYLRAMIEATTSTGRVIGMSGGFDQGLHNILLRKGINAKVNVLPVGNALIENLGGNWSDTFNLDLKRGLVAKSNDSVVSIVHFYDRKTQLLSYYSDHLSVQCQPHSAALEIARTERAVHVIALQS
jgi:hypothetical protein